MKWYGVETELDYPTARVTATGSISCCGITEEQAEEAEAKRQPIGFYSPARNEVSAPFESLVRDAVTHHLGAQALVLERELSSLGECLWTCRDIIAVVDDRVVVG